MDCAASQVCTSAKPAQMWGTEGFTSAEGKVQWGETVSPECFQEVQACKVLVLLCCCLSYEG